MSKFLDVMLRPEVKAVADDLPTAKYEIKRLSKDETVTVTLTALPYGKVQTIRDMSEDVEIQILLAGCPELRDPSLCEKFGGATPVETVKRMLLPGEISQLSQAVERLTGFKRVTISEVKN